MGTITDQFNEWMKTKVQSIHYSNNEQMCNAYERVCFEELATENKKLKERNQYLENELKQAKQLFQELINEWTVNGAEVVK